MEILDSFDSDAGIKVKNILVKCFFTKATLTTETVMEEIKAEVSEKLELEIRDFSKILPLSEILDDEELDIWMKTNCFLIKSSSTSVTFSIQAFTEKIKPSRGKKLNKN